MTKILWRALGYDDQGRRVTSWHESEEEANKETLRRWAPRFVRRYEVDLIDTDDEEFTCKARHVPRQEG
jgi:7,8-dihydro-6-hydroxymethylpterin-pyrophosphokinase